MILFKINVYGFDNKYISKHIKVIISLTVFDFVCFIFFIVGDVSFVVVYTDEKDKSRGCGTVEFDRVESAQKAIDKMHRFDINGRKLVVKEV